MKGILDIEHDCREILQSRLTCSNSCAACSAICAWQEAQIEKANLFTPQIVQVLRDVGALRNIVAHRGTASGMTGHGVSRERNVFSNLDTLIQLFNDQMLATKEIGVWLQAHG